MYSQIRNCAASFPIPIFMYLHCSFEFMYSRQRISQNSFPKFIYIFAKSFMIFRQELLDAAVSLWTNIIPKGLTIIIMMPVPGIEPELPTMSLWKYNKICKLDSNTYITFVFLFGSRATPTLLPSSLLTLVPSFVAHRLVISFFPPLCPPFVPYRIKRRKKPCVCAPVQQSPPEHFSPMSRYIVHIMEVT